MKFATMLQLLNDGHSTEFVQDVYRQGFSKMIEILKAQGITLQEAMALNTYSEDSYPFNAYKQNPNFIDKYQQSLIDSLKESLDIRGSTPAQIEAAIKFVQSLDGSLPLHEQFDLIHHFNNNAKMPRFTSPAMCTYIKRQNIAEHVPELCALIDSALSKSIVQEPITVYRAAKPTEIQDISQSVGYVSTSKDYESSFVKYSAYPNAFELHLNPGVQALNMEPFSDYDSVEKEVLLTNVTSIVTEQRITKEIAFHQKLFICEVYDTSALQLEEHDREDTTGTDETER